MDRSKHETLDELKARIALEFEAERAGLCDAITIGSIYSRKGGNRYECCEHKQKWRVVNLRNGDIRNVCGYHVKSAIRMNASAERIARLLDRETEWLYSIERIENV